eukprot:9278471-Alexandrium_andersonii.AAC.1
MPIIVEDDSTVTPLEHAASATLKQAHRLKYVAEHVRAQKCVDCQAWSHVARNTWKAFCRNDVRGVSTTFSGMLVRGALVHRVVFAMKAEVERIMREARSLTAK